MKYEKDLANRKNGVRKVKIEKVRQIMKGNKTYMSENESPAGESRANSTSADEESGEELSKIEIKEISSSESSSSEDEQTCQCLYCKFGIS